MYLVEHFAFALYEESNPLWQECCTHGQRLPRIVQEGIVQESTYLDQSSGLNKEPFKALYDRW